MKRRPFGSVIQRPSRPGFYVTFKWGGQRIKRSAGPTEAAARKKLAAADAPLCLAYSQCRKKEPALRGDVPRLRVLCRAPWPGKYLAQIRPADFLPWMAPTNRAHSSSCRPR